MCCDEHHDLITDLRKELSADFLAFYALHVFMFFNLVQFHRDLYLLYYNTYYVPSAALGIWDLSVIGKRFVPMELKLQFIH